MDPLAKVRLAAEAMRHALPGFRLLFDKPTQDSNEGERQLELGNFAEAEASFVEVLEKLEARPGRREKHAKVLMALATARWRQSKHEEAKEAAESALELLGATAAGSDRPAVSGAERVECLDLLARIARDREDVTGVVGYLKDALEAQREIRPVDHAAFIERNRRLAEAYGQQSQSEEARKCLEEAVNIATAECGESHTLTAECLTEYGRRLSGCGQHTEAKAALERAAETHIALCGQDSEEVVRDYQALAEACQASEDLEGAVRYFEKALHIRERQLGGNSADMAALLMSLGGTHSLMGRYGPAVELMQQAVGQFEGSRDERLGPALESLGTVYLLCGRADDSIESIKRARKIWEAAPEKYGEKLDANTQLFTTVSSYLGTRQAAALMASLHPPEEEEAQPATEEKPARAVVRRSARRSPVRPVQEPMVADESPLPEYPSYPAYTAYPQPPAVHAEHVFGQPAAPVYYSVSPEPPVGIPQAASEAAGPLYYGPPPPMAAGAVQAVYLRNAPMSAPQHFVTQVAYAPPQVRVAAPVYAAPAVLPESDAVEQPVALRGWEDLSFEFLPLN